MGCGLSKFHLYPRRSKSKSSGKKNGHSKDADTDEDDGQNQDSNDNLLKSSDGNDMKKDEHTQGNDDSTKQANGEIIPILRRTLPQSQKLSSSQQSFFRMLDQKIEAGPDYDSSNENDEPRVGDLVRHWESATYTASIYSTIKENPNCEESDEIQPSAKRKVRNGDVNSANIIEVNYEESISKLTKDSESSNSLLPRTSRCLQISYDHQLDPSESN